MKRIYDPVEADDGVRILVDRIWPRGMTKQRAALDSWEKTSITPTPDLRRWFAHDPEKFDEFAQRYRGELDERSEASEFGERVRAALRSSNVTLLYAAKDSTVNHAVILRDWLLEVRQ
ncbi:DUF488 family protein [Schaalia sp. ZJ1691]|uniref:DUF488 domain-containing protein n=1 Tax=Schaalia sp. ZJ1691 TaxID=2709404 RepID=UPI001F14A92E|nr:DUF488 family protein [Schaalia sp. ZJ1691]